MTTAVHRGPLTNDRAFDDTLERLRELVATTWAIREVHRPALQRRGVFRRPIRSCRECATAYPCATLQILKRSRLLGI